ncbi:transposase family protein [Novosphingobium sp.]|uniref:transposase family protein n=1 Tax=Novosphingobium sp. TaxID=1874826 RepID=UPI002FE3D43C
MAMNNFDPGTMIETASGLYRPMGYQIGSHMWIHISTGEPFRCEGPDGNPRLPTDEDFSRLLRDGHVKLVNAVAKDRVRMMNDHAQWTIKQAEAIDDEVQRKLKIVQMLDDGGVKNGDKAIERFLAESWTPDLIESLGEAEKPRTIRRWRRERGHVGTRHPKQMVSMRGRAPRKSRSPEVMAQLEWKHALEYYASSGTIKDAYTNYTADVALCNEGKLHGFEKPETPFKPVDCRTLRRRIYALESSITTKAKFGDEAYEQDWSGGGAPLVADFAMQYVQVDHTKLDLFTVDDEMQMVLGRAWLSIAIDVYSRAIVAYVISFVDPSHWTVGEILRRMVLPKRVPTHFEEMYPILADLRGKPMELIVDNAVEFRSHSMEAAARSSGFSIRFCPVGMPRYRAVCERTIATLNRLIATNLPGHTLSLKDARRLKYKGEEHACVIMSELEAIANWCIAEYNTHPHTGLNNRQPALVFKEDAERYGISNFNDLDAFMRDTMAFVSGAQLGPAGIKAFDCLRYFDMREVRNLLDDLVPLEGRRQRRDDATATVDYRYNPNDISVIWVFNRKSRTWVSLKCSEERYAEGMPLAFHEQVRNYAKQSASEFNTEEQRLATRAKLISAIKAINPAESARARKTVAKLYEIPRLRQITGQIVHLHTAPSHNVTVLDFLATDRAEPTALDLEILSSRAAPSKRETHQNLADRRNARAGRASPVAQEAAAKQLGLEPSSKTAAPRRRRLGQ